MATTKETGQDDIGLLEFYQEYFNSFPIYKDEKWELYKAMGGKSVGLLGMVKGIWRARARLNAKNIEASKTKLDSLARTQYMDICKAQVGSAVYVVLSGLLFL